MIFCGCYAQTNAQCGQLISRIMEGQHIKGIEESHK